MSALVVVIAGFATLAGFVRCGFNAGLAWFVLFVLGCLFFWPLAILIGAAMFVYGVAGILSRKPKPEAAGV